MLERVVEREKEESFGGIENIGKRESIKASFWSRKNNLVRTVVTVPFCP